MNGLINFREGKGLTVGQMAAKLAISQSYYYKIESGIRNPTHEIIKRFKEVFRVSVDEIFF